LYEKHKKAYILYNPPLEPPPIKQDMVPCSIQVPPTKDWLFTYCLLIIWVMTDVDISLDGEPEDVVMRCAPNPNGPLTIGHARGVVVNSYLTEKYGGTFILRFDDTDPKVKKPLREAYDWIVQDCRWLRCEPDKVYAASERLDVYYEYAMKLIEKEKAYVCQCTQKEFKQKKDKGRPCPHRSQSVEENKRLWSRMLEGDFEEKEAVLRIKTDLKNPDPALRDWVAFRIIEDEHPRVGDQYRVWPMLDFESAIEDHLQEITHIIRGKDLMDSAKRQQYIYDYLGWEYPEVILWGRISVSEYGTFSASKMAAMIETGEASGWSDVKLPTVRAFKRRGIKPESIRQFILDLGLTDHAVAVSMETLYSLNRSNIDDEANRYFFIENPVQLVVNQAESKTVEKPLHPSHRDRGNRVFNVEATECCSKLWIPKTDAKDLEVGDEFRLMHLYNVILDSKKPLVGRMHDVKNFKVPKVQWLPEKIPARVLKPEGQVKGVCEKNCLNLEVGDIIQFERYGFARLDEKRKDELVFAWTHI